MVWKILSALSVVCLAGAAAFAWFYQKDMDKERTYLAEANANVKAAENHKKAVTEALKSNDATIAGIQEELAKAKEEVLKLNADVQEKETALALIKANLDQVTTQVSSVEQEIKAVGDVETLVAQIEKLKKDQLDAEGAVANQNQRVAAAKEQYETVLAQITKARDAEALGRRGIVAPDFTARIAQYFPEWDFAILSKGNAQGVFANADLEVKRGRQVIAKLKVRNVEQYGAIADLIPGSLAEGNALRAGDIVVAAAKQTSDEVKPGTTSTPPAEGQPATPTETTPTAPAGEAPMSSDPFGAPTTPATPAAPAPASDPFGAPATPAAPAAPAMGADPFGAAPAPATPAAPAAPAAPAMGADPFGN